MNTNRRELLRLAALAALSFNGVTARADSWPTRMLRIVHGYDSGSNPDTISRIIGPALSERLGQPIIVEAKPGAAGRIAARHVATQPADGYTLLMLTAGDAVVAALDSTVPYKLLKDFAFVSSVIEFPFLLCVSADSAIKSFADLLVEAKRRPGQLSYGTPGVGTTHSAAGEFLQKMAGIGLLHVPYKGNAFPDLIGGRVDVLIATPSVSLPMILGGKVRAIAVTSRTALPALAEVPPVAQWVPEYEVSSWLGLAVPNGTPKERMQQLSAAVQAAAAVDDVRKALGATGSRVAASSGDAFRDRVERDVRKWATLSGRIKLES